MILLYLERKGGDWHLFGALLTLLLLTPYVTLKTVFTTSVFDAWASLKNKTNQFCDEVNIPGFAVCGCSTKEHNVSQIVTNTEFYFCYFWSHFIHLYYVCKFDSRHQVGKPRPQHRNSFSTPTKVYLVLSGGSTHHRADSYEEWR